MKLITFKQFLSEIDFDDSHTTKGTAVKAVQNTKIDDTYQALPKVKIPGYELFWKEDGPRAYKLVLTKNHRSAIVMDLMKRTVRVPGGTIDGVATEGVYSDPAYRGKGLALDMYKGLIKAGQALFSSTAQTAGSRKIWESLASNPSFITFVVATDAEARWYIRKHPEYEHQNAGAILLTGPYAKLNDEAYASSDTRWLILPKGFENLNMLRDNALELK